MGNSPPTGLRLGINADHSCQVPLGGSATLHFSGREIKQYNNEDIELSWKMSYKVGDSTRDLSLFRCKRNMKNHSRHDYNNFAVVIDVGQESYTWRVERAEADLLHVESCVYSYASYPTTIHALPMPPGNRFLTANAQGGITETVFYLYERETKRDLMVWEWKKKGRAEKPHMATLTHYYANPQNGNDVGFSAALKGIRVLDGGRLDFAVDGPHQHPVKALFYMFDEVRKTGTWNPTYCPHCADNFIIQRRRGLSLQSESEEDTDADNVDVPRAQNAVRSILANNGRFRGNYNGNLIIKNFFARR